MKRNNRKASCEENTRLENKNKLHQGTPVTLSTRTWFIKRSQQGSLPNQPYPLQPIYTQNIIFPLQGQKLCLIVAHLLTHLLNRALPLNPCNIYKIMRSLAQEEKPHIRKNTKIKNKKKRGKKHILPSLNKFFTTR